jgi:indole-3-glycerol phosphate synthase
VPTSLSQIVAATRERVAQSRRHASLNDLERRAQEHRPRGFRQCLQTRSEQGPAVIAELKKASPSRGLIRVEFDPKKLSQELASAGAAALSVLTDAEFFQGSLENLRTASASVSLPCLRKDFIIDEFQVLEARAHCADAILLIVGALPQAELLRLANRARQYQLDVLWEAHDEEELGRALDAGCDLVGINNRDLKTFKVDLETAFRLATLIPSSVLSVAESGIHTRADISRLRAAGYRGFLIGESLMKAPLPGEALSALLAETPAPVSSCRER